MATYYPLNYQIWIAGPLTVGTDVAEASSNKATLHIEQTSVESSELARFVRKESGGLKIGLNNAGVPKVQGVGATGDIAPLALNPEGGTLDLGAKGTAISALGDLTVHGATVLTNDLTVHGTTVLTKELHLPQTLYVRRADGNEQEVDLLKQPLSDGKLRIEPDKPEDVALDVRGWIGSKDTDGFAQVDGGWRLGRWPLFTSAMEYLYLSKADANEYQNLAVGKLWVDTELRVKSENLIIEEGGQSYNLKAFIKEVAPQTAVVFREKIWAGEGFNTEGKSPSTEGPFTRVEGLNPWAGIGLNTGPFALVEGHQALAWNKSHPELWRAELAEVTQELAGYTLQIKRLEQAGAAEQLSAEQLQELDVFKQSRDKLLDEYQNLMPGGEL